MATGKAEFIQVRISEERKERLLISIRKRGLRLTDWMEECVDRELRGEPAVEGSSEEEPEEGLPL